MFNKFVSMVWKVSSEFLTLKKTDKLGGPLNLFIERVISGTFQMTILALKE